MDLVRLLDETDRNITAITGQIILKHCNRQLFDTTDLVAKNKDQVFVGVEIWNCGLLESVLRVRYRPNKF